MKLLGVVLFGNYYLTKISTSNVEMHFGDSFQFNGGLGGYQVHKENFHQFSKITLEITSPALNYKNIDINEWDEYINSYYLAWSVSTSNKLLLPKINFP